MTERRVQAVVIGPAKAGYLKIDVGSGNAIRSMDVPADRIPSGLRMPNSIFLAVMIGGDMVRVEDFDPHWVDTQARIRDVLNSEWDPIGAAHAVDDEYDGYIVGIRSLLERGANAEAIAAHLLTIEIEAMGLKGSSPKQLLSVAQKLKQLQLHSPTGNSTDRS